MSNQPEVPSSLQALAAVASRLGIDAGVDELRRRFTWASENRPVVGIYADPARIPTDTTGSLYEADVSSGRVQRAG